jgi:hypothetical protein
MKQHCLLRKWAKFQKEIGERTERNKEKGERERKRERERERERESEGERRRCRRTINRIQSNLETVEMSKKNLGEYH